MDTSEGCQTDDMVFEGNDYNTSNEGSLRTHFHKYYGAIDASTIAAGTSFDAPYAPPSPIGETIPVDSDELKLSWLIVMNCSKPSI